MARFRKRPLEVDAVQYTGGNYDEIADFVGPECIYIAKSVVPATGLPIVQIRTLEGHMKVSVGDWVIRGVKGEYYPCKPDVFTRTYDYVDASASDVATAS